MLRRRKPRVSISSQADSSFHLRWHSISNTATPSADIMSSPDPLTDPAATPASHKPPPSASRRVSRSQRSGSFTPRSTSPKKQMFELELGEESSPQRLLVTVEADQGDHHTDTTRRRLFPSSSSPVKAMKKPATTTTTTTKVPLRGSIEDESFDALHDVRPPTPRRKRQSNGTPMPGASKRKRQGTPMKGTPRMRKSARVDQPDEVPSDAGARSTPRRRQPGQASTVEQSSDAAAASTAQKRQRKRRQALAPEELATLAGDMSRVSPSSQENDDIDLVRAYAEPGEERIVVDPTPPPEIEPDPESDIWMATLSDASTPRAQQIERAKASIAALSNDGAADLDVDDGDMDLLNVYMGFTDDEDPQQQTSVVVTSEAQGEAAPGTNDTIAQGEDFSMIFADSLPSLQANVSHSERTRTHMDFGEETSFIINKTLESLKRSRTEHRSPRSPLQAAGLAIQVERDVSPAKAVQDDEEPDMPSREATPTRRMTGISPARSLSSHRLGLKSFGVSPLRRRAMKNTAVSSEAPGLLNASDRRDSQSTPRLSGSQAEGSPIYEDSFSEVPESILRAATPGLTTTRLGRDEQRQQGHSALPERRDPEDEDDLVTEQPVDDLEISRHIERMAEDEVLDQALYHGQAQEPEGELTEVDDVEDDQVPWLPPGGHVDDGENLLDPEQQAPPSAASSHFRSETSRLPTPDDTPPSNNMHDDQEDIDKSAALSQAAEGPSPARSLSQPMATSPPQIPDIVEPPRSRQIGNDGPRSLVEKTPLHQISSPPQDPASLGHENGQDRSRRPTLSPIVRAGRALQNITSDPPSPEPREQQLRSPFRSSASKDLPARQSAGKGTRHAGHSPEQSSLQVPSPRQRSSADPFASVTNRSVHNSFMQSLTRQATASPRNARPLSRESIANSLRVTPPAEEMSWVADAGPISPRLRGDNLLRQESPRAVLHQTEDTGAGAEARNRSGMEEPEVIGDEVEEDMGEQAGHEAEEEEADTEEDAVEEAEDDPPEETAKPNDDETDIWELEARRETPRPARQQPFAPGRRRTNLPSPWRKEEGNTSRTHSQAGQQALREALQDRAHARNEVVAPQASALNIADESEEFSMLLQREAKEKGTQPRASTEKSKGFDLSSFFSSPAAIPGMLASKTRALLGSKPAAAAPAPTVQANSATLPTNSLFPQLPTQSFRPRQSPRKNTLLSPQRRQPGSAPRSQIQSSAPPTPSREEEEPSNAIAHEPQPQQLTQKAGVGITPPRMQLNHAEIRRWQQNASAAQENSSPVQLRPLLRPLPSKQASPAKSSLRSPLKPKTPGRVVEFTSSVLSPADQARQRMERLASNSGHQNPPPVMNFTPQPSLAVPSQHGPPVQPGRLMIGASLAAQPVIQDADKVDTSDVVMADASPVDEPSVPYPPEPAPLSQTVWTRRHWLMLDAMLQQRREGPFDHVYPPTSAKYLGKAVRSQGVAMKLEQWHLDCVDAFKAEVGGWDEGALAKRVFALLLGEEKRMHQAEKKRASRKMFH